MMRNALGLFLLFGLLAVSSAHAATFTAKAEDGAVTIYGTSTKLERCNVYVRFTYLEDGQRKDGFTSCNKTDVKPGKNVQVCRFANPQIVAPLIKGDVDAECPPEKGK